VGRDLANRVGATLVAADEAAAEGARWKTYDPAKLADAEWKLSLLGRLDAAIDSGEVWVAYQPQLDVRAGRISGAEALVRWSHPEKGEISPAEFVLAAEQHDRIDKLTAFVLTDAIRVAAEFNARGIEFDVAVNLSARLLERPGLTDTVRGMLADARLAPERLTLEVTESAAMTSGRASIRTLEELGSLGITVSIDDYGTGFSTLEYFKLIPAAEVKIDRSFVVAIDRSASDRLMVQSTIDMAHSLGRHVVAEGVETPQILTELTKMGCDKIQGYLIGKPMKAEELARMVAGHAAANAA
ncbi:MAG TPA: EAL domain-containing protein, partial [Sphingomonas sp.]|nr:EAL domain-containing protein [Sphingomonas sp.]